MTEQDIYVEAMNREDAAERGRFLDEACGQNLDLRARLEKLLQHSDCVGDFLEQPPAPLTMAAEPAVDPVVIGTQIGPYRICDPIGEGGFGVVFMAEQSAPVRRKVALKVIKPGMDTRQVIGRFEAERQALALMDHPNIAKVLDAGATENGRPYFVMELVRGVPITDYCDQCNLTTRERLELFITVCQAVQHAHQKGVIHRDIKPTNVLVSMQDDRPTPKIIDFGVAKAIDQRLTERTLTNAFAQMVGTPLYMSPEQAELSPLGVDTRSDIYSLGVLLYELLTGTTPFDKDRLHSCSYDELRRIIREEEPPRPSTRLHSLIDSLPLAGRVGEGVSAMETAALATTIAERRRTDPRRLVQTVRGELDWIVMKCLEKDRNRRYETPNSLARDIVRYLHDEPVQACPPSATYRVKKFARRNKRALMSSALLGAMMLGMAGTFGWMARDRAAQRGRTSEAVATLLTQCEDALRAGEADQAAVALGAAERRAADGGAEASLERLARCRAELELLRALDAVDTFRWTLSKGEFPDRKAVIAQWRSALAAYGVIPDEKSAADVARLVNASLSRDRVLIALDSWLGNEWSAAGVRAVLRSADPDPFRDAYRDIMALKDRSGAAALVAQPQALEQPAYFATSLIATPGVPEERQRVVLQAALAKWPGELGLLLALGTTYPENQFEGSAERLRWYQAAVAAHPKNSVARNALGWALVDHGDHDAACAAYQQAIELDPSSSFHPQRNLGLALHRRGDWKGAIAAFRMALELNPSSVAAQSDLGAALAESGDLEAGIAALRKAVQLDPKYADAQINLANTLYLKGEFEEAIEHFRQYNQIDPNDVHAHNNLANALEKAGRLDEAIREYREAIRIDPNNGGLHTNLGNALETQGKFDEAIVELREAVRLAPENAIYHNNLGFALAGKGDLESAIASYREAIRLDPQSARAHGNLAETLLKKGDLDGAIGELKEAVRLKPSSAFLHRALGNALHKKGDFDDAGRAYREAIRLAPRDPDSHGNLALILQEKGGVAGALQAHQTAVQLDPQNVDSHNSLGWLMAAGPDGLRDGKQAVEHAERACELTAWHEPISLDTLAAAYAEAGEFEKAAEFQQKALSFPTFERAYGDGARQRLELYKQNKPYRDPALDVESSTRPSSTP